MTRAPQTAIALFLLAAALSIPLQANAQDVREARTHTDAWDVVGIGAASIAGNALFGYTGLHIAAQLSDSCEDLGCAIDRLAIGGRLGGVAGSTLGAGFGGIIANYDGSLAAATIGAGVGSLLAYGASEANQDTVVPAYLFLPPLFATTLFLFTGEPSDKRRRYRQPTALLEVTEDGQSELSTPQISVGVEKDGKLSVFVPVLGGTF